MPPGPPDSYRDSIFSSVRQPADEVRYEYAVGLIPSRLSCYVVHPLINATQTGNWQPATVLRTNLKLQTFTRSRCVHLMKPVFHAGVVCPAHGVVLVEELEGVGGQVKWPEGIDHHGKLMGLFGADAFFNGAGMWSVGKSAGV